MIVVVAVPIMSNIDLSDSTTIEGYDGDRYRLLDDTDTVVFGFDNYKRYMEVNGVRQNLKYGSGGTYPVVTNLVGDCIGVSWSNNSISVSIFSDGNVYRPSIMAGDGGTIVIKAGVISSPGGNNNYSGNLYIMADDGDYINVLDNGGVVPSSNSAFLYVSEGRPGYFVNIILNGSEILHYFARDGSITDVKLNITTSDNLIEYPDEPTITPAQEDPYVAYAILAPYEAGETTATNQAIKDMIGTIPIIMVAGLIIGVAGTFLYRRLS